MSEFSYKIRADKVDEKQETYHIEADDEARKDLAERLKVVSVDSLSADISVQRIQGFVIAVKGSLAGLVTQESKVSLEPVQEKVEDSFEAFFAENTNAVSFARKRQEHIMENHDPEVSFLDERDDPEPIENGQVDLGEVVAQYLSLALNPFPKREEEHFPVGDDDLHAEETGQLPENPFAKLEALKEKLKDKDA